MTLKGEELIDVIKDYFHRNYKYEEIRQLLLKKHSCFVSQTGLKRLMLKYELKRKNVHESTKHDILAAINLELEGSGSNLGYRAMYLRLQKSYGLQVKQQTVLNFLLLLDPDGIKNRRHKRLKRRNYKTPGPNFILHLDGHDKLKRYGFAIHGGIDGFSRKLLWLEVGTTNNDPYTIAHHYLKTFQKLKYIPTIVRSDAGTENVQVEAIHVALRYGQGDAFSGLNSYLTGKSTHNQRIESFWVQLQRMCTSVYMETFKNYVDKKSWILVIKFSLNAYVIALAP